MPCDMSIYEMEMKSRRLYFFGPRRPLPFQTMFDPAPPAWTTHEELGQLEAITTAPSPSQELLPDQVNDSSQAATETQAVGLFWDLGQ